MSIGKLVEEQFDTDINRGELLEQFPSNTNEDTLRWIDSLSVASWVQKTFDPSIPIAEDYKDNEDILFKDPNFGQFIVKVEQKVEQYMKRDNIKGVFDIVKVLENIAMLCRNIRKEDVPMDLELSEKGKSIVEFAKSSELSISLDKISYVIFCINIACNNAITDKVNESRIFIDKIKGRMLDES